MHWWVVFLRWYWLPQDIVFFMFFLAVIDAEEHERWRYCLHIYTRSLWRYSRFQLNAQLSKASFVALPGVDIWNCDLAVWEGWELCQWELGTLVLSEQNSLMGKTNPLTELQEKMITKGKGGSTALVSSRANVCLIELMALGQPPQKPGSWGSWNAKAVWIKNWRNCWSPSDFDFSLFFESRTAIHLESGKRGMPHCFWVMSGDGSARGISPWPDQPAPRMP